MLLERYIIPHQLNKKLVGVGELGLKFNRLTGLSEKTYIEGYHFVIPWLEVPITFKTKVKNFDVSASTPNRDLQLVNLNARVVYKPDKSRLHTIFTELGPQYDKKVLNTIVSEIVRGVVAQFDAQQLNSAREQVSSQMKYALQQRAYPYGVLIDEFAISSINFSKEYQNAVEEKQIAIQQSLEAAFEVEQAKQMKKSIIIQAEADAKNIELIGRSISDNPSKKDFFN